MRDHSGGRRAPAAAGRLVAAHSGETRSGGRATRAVAPAPPGLGGDVATHRARPWGQSIDLGRDPLRPCQSLRLVLQQGNLAKMASNGPPEKHYQRPFCLNASVPRKGMLCMAFAWMGFQPTQVQTSFSLWERGRGRRGSHEARMLPTFKWEGPLWNEHVGREMGQRNES